MHNYVSLVGSVNNVHTNLQIDLIDFAFLMFKYAIFKINLIVQKCITIILEYPFA